MPTAALKRASFVSLNLKLFQNYYLEAKDMKFSYGGVNYQDAPSKLEVTEREIGNMYRGQEREFQYLRHIPEPLPLPQRKFRSVTHSTAQPASQRSTVAAQGVAVVASESLPKCNKREMLNELMNSHLRNIKLSLERRLQVAKDKGDQKLVRLLEAESEQMALF
jgi:hypothetical protein